MKSNSILEKYQKEVISALKVEFGYKNIMSVPKIVKVVVNCGVGKIRDQKQREEIEKYLTLITGQKPSPRPAKKAIASFKTRQGLIVGYKVTLRGARMYDFLSRFVNLSLPRARDFQGLGEDSFDSKGNLTIGIKENIIFPEMTGEDYKFLFGLEVTITTNAKTKKEGIRMLKLMGFPIKQENLSAV